MKSYISFREKFCYGLGDTSANIFMGLTMMFLTVYYTDVFKLNPAAMGTLFLITRILDAVSDPLIGASCDKTRSRLGRYRPWLLWFAVPYGLSCAAVFFSPDLSESGRVIYAYITYIFLVLSFSLVIVPYVSLLGAISDNSDERVEINTIRFPLAKMAYIICSFVVPSLIAMFDSEVIGYRVVMAGVGLLCTVLVLICYFNTQERVTVKTTDLTLKMQVSALLRNDQAMIIFVAQILIMIMNTLKFWAVVYFVKYAMGQDLKLVSLLLTGGSIMGIIAPFIASNLLKKKIISRHQLFFWSQFIGGGIMLSSWLVANDAVISHVCLFLLSTLCAELISILIWATIADCADYGYEKQRVRIDGMIGGGLLFATKLGMAIGGAIMGYVLAYYNYDPTTAMNSTSSQIFSYRLLYGVIPGACMILAAFVLGNYKLAANKH